MSRAIDQSLDQHYADMSRDEAEAKAFVEFVEGPEFWEHISTAVYLVAECTDDKGYEFIRDAVIDKDPAAMRQLADEIHRKLLEAAEPSFRKHIEALKNHGDAIRQGDA